ncbi:cation:dicarboxylase symporter family transporter [Vibrio mediterranei]|uniref:L-cystine transporter n=1 Tax=Vibrio mediterranei TaxID=689 RepID=A0AAN1KR46_9VIBR|nr:MULTISPECIES: cation:dicarboxylase symporter family transporter [Vibrio]ASI93210.1 L-cystine transporter [Vibrio mediterranei]MCF4173616.1 cation:dicarboxylase symporter family transporter [Vibrio sp. McD22-P3]MCY9852568.1 cation:dicarboxylase symporter family transporter [Vibrio mediterranei]MDA0106995.1 cation:dicarboxylase symporter family transporter [Vibrio sp. La 4.2.2]NUW74269.1 cation:dicarboxylase symporter family transporter [Vibrio mediterranei]
MSLTFIALCVLFLGFYAVLANFKKQKKSFNFRVLSALVAGLLFGGAIQLVLGFGNEATTGFAEFISIFGKGYIKLLQMIVIPLVFVAMISSIMNVDGSGALSKIAPKIIGILIFTVAISAVVGIASIYIFGIDANALVSTIGTNSAIEARGDRLIATQDAMASSGLSGLVLSIIPANIFDMLTGSQRTSTLSTVLFGMFLGYSILQVKKRKPEKVQSFVDFINAAKEVVLSMVREILKLTPYGVFALMTTFMMTNDLFALAEMGRFLVASYVAIAVMFVIHFVMVSMFGLSPAKFAKKSWPVLVFGFGSRSSMAAIPLNVETQTQRLGVDEETANMSATFGTSIGQNGCAGIYPAMLAIMAAQVMGMPVDLSFIIQLVAVIAIASFGIAGVGGGATFAAVAVLTIMGLDITVVAILVSIEALIDMARTALNISGSMLSGVVTAKKNGTLDLEQYNAEGAATPTKESEAIV